jgi:DNA-binding CsgD family transcriptional regulator/tetratricopeptide (TPR) repeat protein
MLGREAELGALEDALAACDTGSGAVVLVAGDAGSGKTRLLEEFAARCGPAHIAWGGCVDTTDGLAYAPWTELLGWLVRDLGEDIVGDARAELARLLSDLESFESGGTDRAPSDRTRLFEAIVGVLARAAERRLVCVIEDVHWIDAASRDLLLAVAQRLRRLPILLVVSYRHEESNARLRELLVPLSRGARRIVLDALPPDAARDIASRLSGAAPDSPAAERIVARAAGNPLFIEELAHAEGQELPATLRDLLLARYLGLSEIAQRLVRTAAVIGPRAPRVLLTAAAVLDDSRARHAAREAVEAGVLIVDERSYAFRHALLRQAILDDLVPDERAELHRLVAVALTQRPDAALHLDRTAELATHWDAAERPREALQWTVCAAAQARDRYAFDAALALYERALQWWDAVDDPEPVAGTSHVDLLFDAADAAGDAARYEYAGELARRALDEGARSGPSDCVRAFARARRHMWGAQRSDELAEFAAAALARLDAVGEHTRAHFLHEYLVYLLFDGRPGAAFDIAPRAVAAVEALGDPHLGSEIHQVLGLCYELIGEFDRADVEFETAAALARRNGLHATLALVTYNRASVLSSYPKHDACLRRLDEVEELIERHGIVRLRVAARTLRATEMCALGRLDDATAALDCLTQDDRDGVGESAVVSNRGLIALHAGRYDDARRVLAAFEAEASDGADASRVTDLAIIVASAMAWTGDLLAARDVVADALALLKGRLETYWHGWLALVGVRIEADLAVTARDDGDARLDAAARAETIAESWREVLAQLRSPFPLAEACTHGIDAELARIDGVDEVARARRAADAFVAVEMPYHVAYFRWREAEALLRAADRRLATEVLATARHLASEHGFGGLLDVVNQTARVAQLRLGPGRASVDGDAALSARELEVLGLLVAGRSNPEIAAELVISPHTARAHVSNILEKLGASSRTEAVALAHRRGLL